MIRMAEGRAERKIRRLLGAGDSPLDTRQIEVAWEDNRLRVECNRVRNSATDEDDLAVRILPRMATHYGAVVVPRSRGGRIHLVARYRYAINRWSVECPRFDFDSSDAGWRDAAAADLLRLTGLRAARWRLLGTIQSEPALWAGATVVLAAEGCVEQSRSPVDPAECLAGTLAIEPRDFGELIRLGEVNCGVTLAAWSLYRASRRKPRR